MEPEVRAVMEMLDSVMPRPERDGISAAEARAQIEANLAQLSREPEPCGSVTDQSIPGPGGEIPIRVYQPDSEEPRPGIVYFHGGGWVICGLDTHDGTCRSLANAVGATVVSVDYRLAPEHRYPAAATDAHAATDWVAANAGDLGVDPARLAVAGDSAGGNLAAATALMARDRGGPPLAYQLLVYPVLEGTTELPSYEENATGFFLTAEQMRWYWNQYVPDPTQRAEPYASPLQAEDLGGLPPAFVVTAALDPLRDEGEAYVARLNEAGVQAELYRAEGLFHGFASLADVLPAAKAPSDAAHAAVRGALAAAE